MVMARPGSIDSVHPCINRRPQAVTCEVQCDSPAHPSPTTTKRSSHARVQREPKVRRSRQWAVIPACADLPCDASAYFARPPPDVDRTMKLGLHRLGIRH